MTSNEVTRLLEMIASSYPSYTRQISQNIEGMSLVWSAFLKDIPFSLAVEALYRVVSKSPYPPTLYEFKKEVIELIDENPLDAAEAWGQVMKAVRWFGIYRADEALESLDEITRKVVEAIGWNEICLTENIDTVRAHFIKLYEQYRERKIEEKLMDKKALTDKIAKILDSKNQDVLTKNPKYALTDSKRGSRK